MKTIIIGAGLGGLATACLLASDGHDVTILEKNEHPGGKIGEIKSNGFRFDTGPSLLTMPSILESLFKKCGVKLEDYLSIKAVDPICSYFYPNNTQFDCHQNSCVNIAQIQQFAPADVQAYKKFMAYSQKLYQRTKDAFLFNPLYGLSDLSSLSWSDFLKIDAFKSVAERIDQKFKSPELRKFFKRFTTYNGSSPYQAPATMNVIPHVELSLGGYYINGGMYRLVEAMTELAKSLNVSLVTNQKVQEITTEKGTVCGVKTSGGQIFPADIVVSNADAYETYRHMMDSSEVSWYKKRKIEEMEPSCSGFVLLLGLDKTYDLLSHHNIFFSEDYEREFNQIFNQKVMPDDPTIYVANTSYSDPEHAPTDGSNLFVLVNAPYLNDNWNWAEQESSYQEKIVRALEQRGLSDLSSHINFSQSITPRDFHQKYRSNKGSIYGTSSNSMFSAFVRPRNKARSIKGLYLVGGSTHPGGGIPLVTLSAFHAVNLIKRYEMDS